MTYTQITFIQTIYVTFFLLELLKPQQLTRVCTLTTYVILFFCFDLESNVIYFVDDMNIVILGVHRYL